MFFTYWDDLGSTPARVNRFTGEIQINQRYFDNMPQFYQDFVIEHEKGHFLTNTRSEFEADRYAFKKLAGSQPRSLKNSIKSISEVLSFKNPEHMDRLTEMIKMALEYDYKHNNNIKAQNALNQINAIIQTNKLNLFYMNTSVDNYYEPNYGTDNFDDTYDNAGGRAKRQAKRAAKQANRQANRQKRVEAKVTRKSTRVAGRVANKQQRQDNRFANKQRRQDAKFDNSQREQEAAAAAAEAQNAQYPVDESTYTEDQPIYSDAQYTDQSIEEFPIDQEFQEDEPEEMESFFGDDGECLNEDYYSDNFLGIKANPEKKKARQDRRALKNDKLKAKNEVISARAKAKGTRADAKMELAKQGKGGMEWLGTAVGGIASMFGKGASAETAADPSMLLADPNALQPKLLGMPKGVGIAVIVIIVLAIIGGIFFFLKKKK